MRDGGAVWLATVALWLATTVGQLAVPASPCPDQFSYESDGAQTYGVLRYRPPGGVSSVTLRANFTLRAVLSGNYIGSLEVLGQKQAVLQSMLRGEQLFYRVNFPLSSPLPRLTAIIANGNIICIGQPDFAGPGEAVTSISLNHMLYADGESGPPHYQPAGFDRPAQSGLNPPAQSAPNLNRPQPGQSHSGSFPNRIPTVIIDGQPIDIGSGGFNFESSNDPSVMINTITVSNNPQSGQMLPGNNGQRPNVQFQPSQPSPPIQPQLPPPQQSPPVQQQPPPQPPRPPAPAQCGVVSGGNDRVALVYQGTSVSRGDWPWLTAIYVKRGGGVQYICTGSLISNRHVITAAHCAHEKSSVLAMSVFVVKTGAFNLDSWSDAVIRGLSASHIHPDYDPATLANDILLMKMDSAVEFSAYISAVCLWEGATDAAFVAGQYGTVVGWGLNEIRGSGQGEPRMASIPIVSTDTCRASRIEFHKLTSKNTLCAGDRNGTGPCNGDSGGGLYLLWGGRWRLRGVVSVALRPVTGEAKCNLNEYVVFTDVAQYLAWIQDNMSS